MEGGGAMEGWGARAHSPALVVACVCSCMLAIVCRRSSHVWSSSGHVLLSAGICCCPWALIIVHGHSSLSVFPLVGTRFHLWVAGIVCGCAFQCHGVLLGGW